MKIAILVAVLALALAVSTPQEAYDRFQKRLDEPSVEDRVDNLLGKLPESVTQSKTYPLIRYFTGCAAGWAGLADNIFTDIEIIRSNPKSWFNWLFGVLFFFAYKGQNGPYMQYMCVTFKNYLAA